MLCPCDTKVNYCRGSSQSRREYSEGTSKGVLLIPETRGAVKGLLHVVSYGIGALADQ